MLLDIKSRIKQNLEKPENNWGTDSVGQLLQRDIKNLTNEIGWLQTLKKEMAHSVNIQRKCTMCAEVRNIA